MRPAVMGLGASTLLLATLLGCARADSLPTTLADQSQDSSQSTAEPRDEGTATKARQILFQHCYRCHQGPGSEGGEFDVLNLQHLTTSDGSWESPLVVAGAARESYLLDRIRHGQMPPPRQSNEKVSEEEIAVLTTWIDAGAAKFPEIQAELRGRVSLEEVIDDAYRYFGKLQRDQRSTVRFITFHPLLNKPRLPAFDIKLHHAALSKTLNSLSRQDEISVPTRVSGNAQMVAIDLRDFGWDEDVWHEILRHYPYGLGIEHYPGVDERAKNRWREIVDRTGTPLPIIRGDWLIAHAMRPPLYHRILGMPETSQELEQSLSVDLAAAFRAPATSKLMRAGFSKSGVSSQNRAVDRLPIAQGVYLKSYDFGPDAPRGKLIRFPLGPRDLFAAGAHPFADQAFAHDGGEIIYSLPNGLHAYLLVDSAGKRIDEGPVSIVSDALRTSGTPAIVNGLSCVACHKQGVLPLQNTVRNNVAVFGDAAKQAEVLYASQSEWDRRLEEDRAQYMAALGKAMGPFLDTGERAQLAKMPEPISEVVRMYAEVHLTTSDIAAELDLDTSADLIAQIGARNWQSLGLESLRSGGSLKRAEWESGAGISLMQEVASELGYTPLKQSGVARP